MKAINTIQIFLKYCYIFGRIKVVNASNHLTFNFSILNSKYNAYYNFLKVDFCTNLELHQFRC